MPGNSLEDLWKGVKEGEIGREKHWEKKRRGIGVLEIILIAIWQPRKKTKCKKTHGCERKFGITVTYYRRRGSHAIGRHWQIPAPGKSQVGLSSRGCRGNGPKKRTSKTDGKRRPIRGQGARRARAQPTQKSIFVVRTIRIQWALDIGRHVPDQRQDARCGGARAMIMPLARKSS